MSGAPPPSSPPPRPRAFRLDAPPAPGTAPAARPPGLSRAGAVTVIEEADAFTEEAAPAPARPLGRWRRRLPSLGGLFWSSLGLLLALSALVSLERLVNDLAASSPWLGRAALALAAVLALTALAVAARELAAVRRLARVTELHRDAAEAHARDDAALARAVVRRLEAHFAAFPGAGAARATLAREADSVIDGADLLKLAERAYLAPADAEAARAVAGAARRVSLVTAIAPRALIDVLFVLAQSVRLIRRVSAIYGARPGALGALGLARRVGGHLALTGGMAVTDGLVGQVLGHGLAARLSARLGEGVLNGLLTARVGLAAIAVCRPLPYLGQRPPTIGDVAAGLLPGRAPDPPRGPDPARDAEGAAP